MPHSRHSQFSDRVNIAGYSLSISGLQTQDVVTITQLKVRSLLLNAFDRRSLMAGLVMPVRPQTRLTTVQQE